MEGGMQMPKRFEWVSKEKQMALAGLCQYMICVSSMPLTSPQTQGETMNNESLLTHEVHLQD